MTGEYLKVAICAYADMDVDQDRFTIRGDWSAPGSPSIVGHYSLADFGKLAVRNLSAGRPLVINDNLRELALEEAVTFQNIGIAGTICDLALESDTSDTSDTITTSLILRVLFVLLAGANGHKRHIFALPHCARGIIVSFAVWKSLTSLTLGAG